MFSLYMGDLCSSPTAQDLERSHLRRLNKMGRALKIAKAVGSWPTTSSVDTGFNNPDGTTDATPASTPSYGVVGGVTSLTGDQVLTRVAIGIAGVGTITVSTASADITGIGTDLVNTFSDGTAVSTSDGTVLGYITDIANANATFATFSANSLADATSSEYVYADNAAGYIIRQKGKRKYLVGDATTVNDEDMVAGRAYRIVSVGNTDWNSVGAGADAAAGKIFIATAAGAGTGTVNLVGTCRTANLANADLTVNTMNLVGTTDAPATVRLDSLTNYFATDFTDNGTDENAGTKYVVTFNSAVAANVDLGYPNGVISIQKG